MKYELLTSDTVSDLNLQVNALLEKGWRVYGSPIVTPHDHRKSRFYAQAVTFDEVKTKS